ncbi:hypothetical protein [Methylobacterium soli]|nr:hypothetical protein [Methylobacterium soli]GJE42095.1 hypothetical protein AEGHOMDF_1266 [Methylobacterium soli]
MQSRLGTGFVLAGCLLMLGWFGAGPASAQRLEIGPEGPSVDLRSRQQRAIDREDARRDREELRRDRDIDDDDDADDDPPPRPR